MPNIPPALDHFDVPLRKGDQVKLLDFSANNQAVEILGRERLRAVGQLYTIQNEKVGLLDHRQEGPTFLIIIDLVTRSEICEYSYWPARWCMVYNPGLSSLVRRYRQVAHV